MDKSYSITVSAGADGELRLPDGLKTPHSIVVEITGGASANLKTKIAATAPEVSWSEGLVTATTESGRYTPVYSYILYVTVAGSATLHVRG